jgi:hypothetical protein
MDSKQLQTHIGKVKSHTDIEYNELVDKAARVVVDGEALPDIIFTLGGLRKWPQLRKTTPKK